MIRQEITAAFTQYTAAQHALEIYTHGVREVARQNLEVVRKTSQLGRATLLDLIAEQRRYIDVETGYTEALKLVYDAVVEIERTIGTMDR
jgi:cobalt-zinc-cadmium efflux system outer membrane protein